MAGRGAIIFTRGVQPKKDKPTDDFANLVSFVKLLLSTSVVYGMEETLSQNPNPCMNRSASSEALGKEPKVLVRLLLAVNMSLKLESR